jgi:hypothetical protein
VSVLGHDHLADGTFAGHPEFLFPRPVFST